MNVTRILRLGAVAALAALLILAPEAHAQVDMSGDWVLEVTTEQGTTMPALTLQQDGNALTGHYSSETLGEADVTGMVESYQVTISFFADPGVGQEVPVIYTGTVDGDGVWTGSLDLAGGLATGTFRATKS